MMDGRVLYNEPFHPFSQYLTFDGKRFIHPQYTRSQRNVRYYYIDFGYAKWFHDPNEARLVTGSRARERTPEQLSGEPYDPFRADVYQLGAIIRRDLIPVCSIVPVHIHSQDVVEQSEILDASIPLAFCS
jgi:serine/threonine protein kinase